MSIGIKEILVQAMFVTCHVGWDNHIQKYKLGNENK